MQETLIVKPVALLVVPQTVNRARKIKKSAGGKDTCENPSDQGHSGKNVDRCSIDLPRRTPASTASVGRKM